MLYTSDVKAIIFDLDGVIIDTERTVWLESSRALLSYYGKTHDEEKIRPLIMGSRFEEGTKLMLDFYEVDDSFEHFLARRRELVRKMLPE